MAMPSSHHDFLLPCVCAAEAKKEEKKKEESEAESDEDMGFGKWRSHFEQTKCLAISELNGGGVGGGKMQAGLSNDQCLSCQPSVV